MITNIEIAVIVAVFICGLVLGYISRSPYSETMRVQKQVLTNNAPENIIEIASGLNKSGFIVVPIDQWETMMGRYAL